MDIEQEITGRKEALDLARMPLSALLESADRMRVACSGQFVELCAIINIRNGGCDMDCRFCAQRKAEGQVAPALMDSALLRENIEKLATWPVAHIGLVSSGGSLGGKDLEKLCQVINSLPSQIRSRICVSAGRLGKSQLLELRGAGVCRYHHNLETSRNFYPSICRSQTWQSRLQTAERALAAGFTLCCGCLFGLGESWEDRIDLAFTLKELGCDSQPLNFLDPRPGTPLGHMPRLGIEEALRVVALYRHILPTGVLRVCGGRTLTFGNAQPEVFKSGANALMTGDFLTTRGLCLESDLAMLAESGLVVSR